MAEQTDHIAALREAGHDDAADLLERVQTEKAHAELARRGPGETRPKGVALLSDDAARHPAGEVEAARGMLDQINGLRGGRLSVPLFDDRGQL